ncbi:MAG: PilZ domain-containing protein, partial [Thiogranum sp.]
MVEKRKHVRTEFSGRVKVMHPQFDAVEVELRDISNGGVFLFTGDQFGLSVGEVVRVPAQD